MGPPSVAFEMFLMFLLNYGQKSSEEFPFQQMIINWFPFRSLAMMRPINCWPKYTTHTSASYTPANCCLNFKVKAFQNLVCSIQDRCQGYFDIWINNMLKISLSQTSLHHVWSSIVHPGKYKPSFTSLQHSFRTNSFMGKTPQFV